MSKEKRNTTVRKIDKALTVEKIEDKIRELMQTIKGRKILASITLLVFTIGLCVALRFLVQMPYLFSMEAVFLFIGVLYCFVYLVIRELERYMKKYK